MSGSAVNTLDVRFDGAKRDYRQASHRFVSPRPSWDGEAASSWNFRGVFSLMEQEDLGVGFCGEHVGRSFRRSETRLSPGFTPFCQPTAELGWRSGVKLEFPGRFQLDGARGFGCRVLR